MTKIIIGLDSCGIAAGGIKVKGTLEALVSESKLDVAIGETGCMGMCYYEKL